MLPSLDFLVIPFHSLSGLLWVLLLLWKSGLVLSLWLLVLMWRLLDWLRLLVRIA